MSPICCIFLFFIARCFGIAEEYYDDFSDIVTSSSSQTVVNNMTVARRVAEKMEHDEKNKTNDFDSSEDDEFKVYVVNLKQRKLKYNVLNDEITTILTTPKRIEKPASATRSLAKSSNNITHLFLKDYEYIYDDASTQQSSLSKHHQNLSESTSTTNVPLQNISRPFYTDFFNLEPAAEMPENEQSDFIHSNNDWYVPEMYPCWQLPVLYGELGSKKNTKDIFLTHKSYLKNVVFLEDLNVSVSNDYYDMPAAASHNKWCESEPCYGDHTLCLFSDYTISKICDEGYSVKVPSTLEEIGLVSVVNSMRNRIAIGDSEDYRHLPPARNMKQMLYDYDLEKMAAAWLRQCLPGPPPCTALDGHYVRQLECTKYADECCVNSFKVGATSNCIPKDECFIPAIIGCIYSWFQYAGKRLQRKDIECGHIDSFTYNTAQLIWANTNKIGCAYGERPNGDIRVVCDFAPGAPYYIRTKYYCGFVSYKDITHNVALNEDIDFTNLTILSSMGLHLNDVNNHFNNESLHHSKVFEDDINVPILRTRALEGVSKLYNDAQMRQHINDNNVTKGMVAKLVTRYMFFDESESKCDTNEPIYIVGEQGSLCVEKGWRYQALCYDFRDPTPVYRLVAVLAPFVLFSLILYDLFSGVVRQTNY